MDTIYLSAEAAAASGAIGPMAPASGPTAIALGSELGTIINDLVVIGLGSDVSEIDMGGNGRAFTVARAVLTPVALAVRNGAVDDHGGCTTPDA